VSEYAVVLVYSTGHAIQAERVLNGAGVDVKLVPTPRHLSSDCGSAVRIAATARDAAEKLLAGSGVEIDRIVMLDI